MSNRLRTVDWRRVFYQIPGTILRIEFDPVRSGLIALIKFAHNICNYRLLANGLQVGNIITSHITFDEFRLYSYLNVGDSSRLINMPRGVTIYNVESSVGIGGTISRSAGTFCTLMYKFTFIYKCLVKLPSTFQFSIDGLAVACKGMVCNILHRFESIGKAGRNR
jgi:large subunit ribosomal protein L2